MGVQVAWYYKPYVTIMKLDGTVLAQEFRDSVEQLYDWFEESDAEKIHLIVDATELEQLPSIADLTKIKLHHKRGMVLMFGVKNRIIEFVASVAVQIIRMELKFVHNLDEANIVLGKINQNLGEVPVNIEPEYKSY